MKSARRSASCKPAVWANRGRALIFGGALLVFLGAGCSIPAQWSDLGGTTATSTHEDAVVNWTEVAPGIARFDERLTDEGMAARLILWRIEPQAGLEWSVVTGTAAQLVSAWSDQEGVPAFVLNAGYFHEDGSPSGWVQAGGVRYGKRAFDADRTGYVALGRSPTLLAGATPTSTIKVDALQSYPWLIKQGKISFTEETGQYARRTFVGTDRRGNWYVGVVPSESVTLYQLAHLLKLVPETDWVSAMNLDGGPSTGLMTNVAGVEDRFDSFAGVSYVIVGKWR